MRERWKDRLIESDRESEWWKDRWKEREKDEIRLRSNMIRVRYFFVRCRNFILRIFLRFYS